MTRERTPHHLRLVAGTETERIAEAPALERAALRKATEQLELPYVDPFAIMLANVEGIGPDQFSQLLSTLHPKWIIDARAVPRLDVIGGTRGHAFRLFQHHGAEYVDLFGRLGLTTYRTAEANPALWAGFLGQIIRESPMPRGPFLILFDDPEMLDASSGALPSSLCNVLGHKVFLSVLDQWNLQAL